MRSNSLLVLTIFAIAAGGALYLPASALQAPKPAVSTSNRDTPNPPHTGDRAAEPATDAVTLIGEYFGVDTRQKPSRTDTVDAVRRAAVARDTTVRFLIATLPDYVDSHMRWDFDSVMQAVQAGANSANYGLDRFYLPDWDPARDPDTNPNRMLLNHEDNPGVVLMKRRDPRELLVLFVVGETPTAGIHKKAFLSAARLVRQLTQSDEIRVLGPMYSGSRESLKTAIRLLGDEDGAGATAKFRLVSGSATDPCNKAFFEGVASAPGSGCGEAWPRQSHDPQVTFWATVRPDNQLEKTLIDYIRPRLNDKPIARLLESNTGWGRSLDKGNEGRDVEYIDFPFPLHISRLQAESETARSQPAQPPSRFMNLSFVEPQATDQLPALTPKTTLPSVELIVSGLLDQIRRERFTAVMIAATDARDRLFLAHQIRASVPDVTLLAFESDLLYTHPSYAADTHGMVVTSSYPLHPMTQAWSAPSQHRRRLEFRSQSAQGVYNATVALLDGPRDAFLDYWPVGKECANECLPPVWLTVVGRNGLWPIAQATPDDADHYVLAVRKPETIAAALPLYRPSIPVILILTAIALWTTYFAAGFLAAPSSEQWPLVGRFDLVPQAERHRHLLACFGTAAIVDVFNASIFWAATATQWTSYSLVALVGSLTGAAASVLAIGRAGGHAFASKRMRYTSLEQTALCALGGIGAVALLVHVRHIKDFTAAESLLFVNRVMYPGNHLSPAVPILLVAAAVYLWSILNIRRLGMPRTQRINDRLTFVETLIAYEDDVRPVSEERSPWATRVPLVAGLVFWAFVAPRSHEGPAFDWLYWSGSAIVYTLVADSVWRLARLWRQCGRVLKQLAWHPVILAFKRLPAGTFKSTITAEAPDLADLQPLIDRWRISVTRSPAPGALAAGAGTDVHETLRRQMAAQSPEYQAAVLGESAAVRQSRGSTELKAIERRLQQELSDHSVRAWSDSRTWRLLQAGLRRNARNLRPIWRRRGRVPQQLAAQEEAIAIAIGLAIREVLARMANSALFIMAALFLVLASHTFFPFYPRQTLLAVSWLFIITAMVATLGIFVAIDRDEAISAMTGTKAGQVNWDMTMLSRIIVYGIVPLGSLIAVQFPQLGDTILQWIQPMQHGLP